MSEALDRRTDVEVSPVGPDDAGLVLAIVREAFAARPALDPPAAALGETEASIRELLGRRGGLLARVDGVPVGVLVLDPVGSTTYLRRFGVLPSVRRHGVAGQLIDAAVAATLAQDPDGTTVEDLAVVAREELPATVLFWVRQGFREISRSSPDVQLRRPLRTTVRQAATPADMHDLARAVARQLGPGDLVVLVGGLGAGKTTFTQGLGEGLGVRGAVTSPTFVISRVHPSQVGGPPLVHVDAYRLGGIAELDDLDLDTSLADAVTVVEWGEGLVEQLSDSRLEVRIERDLPLLADVHDGAEADLGSLDPRRVEITPVGPRWHGFALGEG